MRSRHKIRRALLRLFSVLFCIAMLAVMFFGIKGYRMYREATTEKPIEKTMEEIRGREHFTKYSELPQFYINAVISVEDHRFEKHPGIDFVAVCRAAWVDIRSGYFREGGSTITQQIAKNMLFTQEKRIERKVAEVFAAYDMEKNYTKEELFELYVNTANFGSGYEGIYAASMGYFGKLPEEVTDYEAAMLAGVPNAPSMYSPDISRELAARRVVLVLQSMVRHHVITQEEAELIQQQGLSGSGFEE